ncbi:MAG: helix-turn-helix transcriptional regulator [Clostridia bacterium]|nr:helix-turn-helix transcriptional regulator [Clostridia bacterium]
MKNRLYFIRTQKALSLKDVSTMYAVRFGEKLSARILGKIEAGDVSPAPEVFMNLADLLDVTIDYLLCKSDTPDEELRIHQKGMVEPKKDIL